mgnify:CR=1 FL=1
MISKITVTAQDVANQLSPVLGAMVFRGTWNATTNIPNLGLLTPENGDYYIVSVAGSTSLNSITSWGIKDWAIYNSSIGWQKIDNTDSVASVAGRTGTVTLAKGDVGLESVDNTADADKPVSSATVTALAAKEATANKGAASGYAGLGSDSRVAQANLPGLALVGHTLVGDGSDGALVYDGVATILGMAPNANRYTLTRDIYATNLTVNSGITIRTGGFRIFCRGTLANAGTISCNGSNAVNNTGGAGYVNAGTLGITSGAGANGITSGGVGQPGGTATSGNIAGSSGGSGGAAGPNGGGTGGTTTVATAAMGSIRDIGFLARCRLIGNQAANGSNGGGSGGATIGGGAGATGGGGSAAGGVVISCITLNNTGTISANGGVGGNASGITGDSVCGGGGGGAGGWVFVLASIVIATGTIQASGGLAGFGGGGGGNGVTGTDGLVITLFPVGL